MTLFIIFAALIVFLGWLLLGGRDSAPEPTAHRRVNETIDYTTLEDAEREAREAPDELSLRDWGPGTGAPPVA